MIQKIMCYSFIDRFFGTKLFVTSKTVSIKTYAGDDGLAHVSLSSFLIGMMP